MSVLSLIVEKGKARLRREEMHYRRAFWFIFPAVFVLDRGGNGSILSSHPLLTLSTLQVDYFWLIVLLNALALSILAVVAAPFLKAEK